MSANDLVEMLRGRPFQPFTIHTTDGETYEVRHPEMMHVGRTTAVLFIPPAGQSYPLFDRYITVALLHIARMERVETTAA